METFLNFVGPLVIRELTGETRVLRLAGRTLPARPYTLTGTQRVAATWYPGAPVATAQVLGAKEEETSFGGWWKDRFLSRSPDESASLDGDALVTVVDLAELVDDVRRKGQLCEVVWMHTARTGYLTRFTQKWHNQHDLEYDLTFEWVAADADDAASELGRREVDLSDAVRSSAADVNGLDDFLNAPPDLNPLTMLRRFGAQLANLQLAVLDANDAVQGALDGALLPLSTARRLVAAFGFVMSQAREVEREAYARVDADIKLFEGMSLADLLPGQVLSATVETRRITRQARRAKHGAAQSQARALRNVDPDLAATFVAREGDDLRRVSTEFYGVPDQWQELARFNNLSSSRLAGGQVLLVPRTPGAMGEC